MFDISVVIEITLSNDGNGMILKCSNEKIKLDIIIEIKQSQKIGRSKYFSSIITFDY